MKYSTHVVIVIFIFVGILWGFVAAWYGGYGFFQITNEVAAGVGAGLTIAALFISSGILGINRVIEYYDKHKLPNEQRVYRSNGTWTYGRPEREHIDDC